MEVEIKVWVPDTKSIYNYTLGELLGLVEKETGKKIEEITDGLPFSLSFPSNKSFFFSTK